MSNVVVVIFDDSVEDNKGSFVDVIKVVFDSSITVVFSTGAQIAMVQSTDIISDKVVA